MKYCLSIMGMILFSSLSYGESVWYVVPVVERTILKGTAGFTFWQPDVPDGLNYSAAIDSGINGVPQKSWCLVLISTTPDVHALLAADNTKGQIPALADTDRLNNPRRQAIRNALTRLGITDEQSLSLDTFVEFMNSFGKTIHGNFNKANYKAGDS